MSNLSGLPPASIARAAAAAALQDVAVRLINLPDTLRNNPDPVKVTGTVKGQTPDGSVQVETQRGVINILLKDRGALPVGQKIEIDIPAGRPPQQAAIRAASETVASAPSAPVLPAGEETVPPSPAAPFRLDRTQTLKPDDVAQALSGLAAEEEAPQAGPLQAGQILRLVPVSPTPAGPANAPVFLPQELFESLMNMLSQAVDLPLQTRQNLIQILARVDLSTLLPASPEDSSPTQQAALVQQFQKLVQQADLPESVQLRNTPLQNTPASLFNSARPLDVRILAFETGAFETALARAASPGQPPSSPALSAENFVVLPQPPAVPVPVPVSVPAQALQTQPPALTPQTAVPPPAAPPPAAAPAAPLAVLGQVTGFTAQGQPVLSLALPGSAAPQSYAIQFAANNLPEGAPVLVSPLSVELPLRPGGAPPLPGLVSFALGAERSLADWAQPDIWDTLQTLIGAVSHINPALSHAMTQMLPNAANPQTMGPLSMFFLSVMRSGELDTWIGQPAIALIKQSGKTDLLRALTGESLLSNRLEATPLPNDWRAAVFPFWHDQQVHKLPLYYKQWEDEKDTEEENDRRRKLRFMFELKLSRMGPVQVDGFMQSKKLDMILRTKAPVGLNMQDALRKLYHKAMERSNLSGEIAFQFKPEQWVQIPI